MLLLACAAPESDSAFDPAPDGADLFVHRWTVDDPLAGGDGLGPRYNEQSCAACHVGPGGAGDEAHDVVFVAGEVRPRVRLDGERPPEVTAAPVRRQTPALWGIGALDAIDAALLPPPQTDVRFPEIRGRYATDAAGAVTRFGWKGDVRDLRSFVAQACAHEIGLTVDGDRVDLDEAQLDAMTAYVAALPAPIELPSGMEELRGAEVFSEVGCEGCHRASIVGVAGAYTDLMLHDLGGETASVGLAYGAEREVVAEVAAIGTASALEWRTPPLWGVADSGPWLHDGRARTLQEAVVAHGGEASATVRRWRRLGDADRAALDAFLETLRAPTYVAMNE